MFWCGVWRARCLLILCVALAGVGSGVSEDQGASVAAWVEETTPSPAADIIAVGNTFWICGADEMIASSSDGGATWTIHHQVTGGKILLHIAFVNDKVGHAAGKGGLFLSTVDGGNNWVAHNAGDDVWTFSFSDANNGVAVIGGDVDINRSALFVGWGDVTPMDSPVKLTHDGGEHWEDIPALKSGEFAAYKSVLAVAALDANFLMLRRQPNVADAYVISEDGGKSWGVVHPTDNETNRELPRWVFVHDGEYWAFGMELVHRETRGGYGVPLVLHSKDGASWTHGASGKNEFGSCNPQGCNIRDGIVEALYGPREQYWAVPQDGSLTNRWAIAGNRLCTIGGSLRCATVQISGGLESGTAAPSESHLEGKFANLPFAKDCVACAVWRIPLDPGMNWQGRVVMSFRVDPDGSVSDWSEDGAPDGPLGALIEVQFKHWKFAAPGAAAGERRHLTIDVKCVDEALVPTMDGCELKPTNAP